MATNAEIQFVIIVSTFWIVAVMLILYVCVKRSCRNCASAAFSRVSFRDSRLLTTSSLMERINGNKTQDPKDGDVDISINNANNIGNDRDVCMKYNVGFGEEITVKITDAEGIPQTYQDQPTN